MKHIHFIQAGEHGAVRIAHTTPEAIRRTQVGNPDPLTIRGVYDGDTKTLRELHERYSHHHIRDDWFAPQVLEQPPEDLTTILYDYDAQGRAQHAERQADARHRANLVAALMARTPVGEG